MWGPPYSAGPTCLCAVSGSGCTSVARQSAVRGAVRASCLYTKAFNLVLFVAFEVAFEPVPLSRVLFCAFPREDVRGHTVEEPAVVG